MIITCTYLGFEAGAVVGLVAGIAVAGGLALIALSKGNSQP